MPRQPGISRRVRPWFVINELIYCKSSSDDWQAAFDPRTEAVSGDSCWVDSNPLASSTNQLNEIS